MKYVISVIIRMLLRRLDEVSQLLHEIGHLLYEAGQLLVADSCGRLVDLQLEV